MWFWIISAIAGGILGNAVDSWFSETKLGIWFYGKVADISGWAAKKLKLQTLSIEEALRKKYHNIAEKINKLEDKEINPSNSWAPHQIFNVGNSSPVPLMQFIEVLEECLGKKANKIKANNKFFIIFMVS